jgi:hypothetical protein
VDEGRGGYNGIWQLGLMFFPDFNRFFFYLSVQFKDIQFGNEVVQYSNILIFLSIPTAQFNFQ